MPQAKACPHCGGALEHYRNPLPTVDILIELAGQGIVLIERRNPPFGWALPGGFIDYGESAEHAAVREAEEETGLKVELTGLLGVYSDPGRDPRQHTLSLVYTAQALNPAALKAADDAMQAQIFAPGRWPSPLAFDHALILEDYLFMRARLNRQAGVWPQAY